MELKTGDLKFLRERYDTEVLFECVREAVTMFFEGSGIPPVLVEDESKKKKSMAYLSVLLWRTKGVLGGSAVYVELEKQATSSLIDYLLYRDEVVQEQALMLILKRASAGVKQLIQRRAYKQATAKY